MPAIASKQPEVRSHHVFEDEPFDDERLARWIVQAAQLPGQNVF